jgi:methylenetetrahydrofolate reductase (NADPH)
LIFRTLVTVYAVPFSSGRSSAWLECCVRDAEVAGSNPVAPTNRIELRGNLIINMSDSRTIASLLSEGRPLRSVEFFPPKDEAAGERMLKAAAEIEKLEPDFVSITYGAGGSTRDRSLKYATLLQEEHGFRVMPHLTCVGHAKSELCEIIDQFYETGFRNIMALRGDPPKGETDFKPHPDGLAYANELVALIKDRHPDISIGVAGYPETHPEATSAEEDIKNLARKVMAGADFVTTQLFFENAAYYRFVDQCSAAGIEVPIIPGILPVLNLAQVRRFCEMCQAELPKRLENQLEAAGDDSGKAQDVGINWAYEQVQDLLYKGAPGFHLYILNRAKPIRQLTHRLVG